MEIEDSKYDTLKVLICDDSALMRNLVSRIINDTPGMQVVGKAMNGKMLLDEIPYIKPDVILLDIDKLLTDEETNNVKKLADDMAQN